MIAFEIDYMNEATNQPQGLATIKLRSCDAESSKIQIQPISLIYNFLLGFLKFREIGILIDFLYVKFQSILKIDL